MERLDQDLKRLPQTETRPAVSVIIPAYHTAAYIGEALESVFAQTFRDYEVIVINDGSPDTEEMERAIQPYRDRIVYIKQENRGLAGARNTGIRAARAPYIALLDSDDLWEPEYLAVQVAALESDPTIDVIYPNAIYFGDSSEVGMEVMALCPSEGEVTFESLVTQKCNVVVSVTARRDSVVRAGIFDESLRSSEDFDLWLRMVKQGGRIAYHRRPLVRYRRRAGSLSSDPVWMSQQGLRVLEKAERTMDITAPELETLRRERARFYAELRFCEGKRAFFKGEIAAAAEAFRESNRFQKNWKVTLALLIFRLAPRLFLHAYDLRDRLVLGKNTKF